MGHFAKLNENNIVIEVNSLSNFVFEINGIEDEAKGIEFLSSISNHLSWKQTSYNTRGGVYYESDNTLGNNQSKAFRKNYAGIGYTYDEQRDAFIPPKIYNSWIINEDTCLWESPIPYPNDENLYYWSEDTISWIKSEI